LQQAVTVAPGFRAVGWSAHLNSGFLTKLAGHCRRRPDPATALPALERRSEAKGHRTAQHPNHQGNRVALRRFFGHLACNMNYELPVRLLDLPKEPEEFPLSSVQGFHCACGDGLGLSFPLEE